MAKKWHDITTTVKELRERRAAGSRRSGPLTLGDMFDLSKLHSVEDAAKVEEDKGSLAYVDRGLNWLDEQKGKVLVVPPEGYDCAVLKNWVWFSGRAKRLEIFGIKHEFVVNQHVALMPTLVVNSKLLLSMNQEFRKDDNRRTFSDAELNPTQGVSWRSGVKLNDTNCCVASDWDLEDFFSAATNLYEGPYLSFVRQVRPFRQGSVRFFNIPSTEYSLTILEPDPGFLQYTEGSAPHWECSVSDWGIFYEAEVKRDEQLGSTDSSYGTHRGPGC